jgi:hypothetical protein
MIPTLGRMFAYAEQKADSRINAIAATAKKINGMKHLRLRKKLRP